MKLRRRQCKEDRFYLSARSRRFICRQLPKAAKSGCATHPWGGYLCPIHPAEITEVSDQKKCQSG